MKKLILIAVLMIVFGGCDDASSKPNEGSSQEAILSSSSKNDDDENYSSSIKEPDKISEIVVNNDCTTGSEIIGIEFDSDSVRCGRKGHIYFGFEWEKEDDKSPFSQIIFYLLFDSSARVSNDSVWIFETDSAKYSTCEKLEIPHADLSGTFCLKNFEDENGRESVPRYVDFEKRIDYGRYFVYSKYGFYKAFCNVDANSCNLLYSCVVRYDRTYNFSKVPSVDNVKRNGLQCVD